MGQRETTEECGRRVGSVARPLQRFEGARTSDDTSLPPTMRGDAAARESGAAMVMVALMLVTFFGIAALVIDFGALMVERRSLQNAADAAALAIAQDCAVGTRPCDQFTAERTAQFYADANSFSDGTSGVRSVVLDLREGSVEVYVHAEDVDGEDGREPMLAGLLGWDRLNAEAVSTARWVGGSAHPITVSECETRDASGALLPVGPSHPVTLTFHDAPGSRACAASTSGADLPGGFGWLDAGANCGVAMQGGRLPGRPGVEPPTSKDGCDMNSLRELLMGDILLPVFEDVEGEKGAGGANAQYQIAYFSRFHVTAFKLFTANQYQRVSTVWNDPSCLRVRSGGAQTVCVDGYFVEHDIPVESALDVVAVLAG